MSEEEEEKEEPILVLRRSRKVFLVEYSCSVLFLLLLGISKFRGWNLPDYFKYFILGIAIIIVVYAESMRFLFQYRITPSKIAIIKGIIKKNHKNIYFRSLRFVPDLNLKQGWIQRVLDYGTVFIESQGESHEHSMEIRDVDHPAEVLRMIEKQIEKEMMV